jgi:hypothetical protein
MVTPVEHMGSVKPVTLTVPCRPVPGAIWSAMASVVKS